MIYKYNVVINDDKTEVEACKQSSAIQKVFHEYIENNKLQKESKVVLEITSEKLGEVEEVKMEGEKVVKEEVDLKKAQEEIDKSRVVIQEGNKPETK